MSLNAKNLKYGYNVLILVDDFFNKTFKQIKEYTSPPVDVDIKIFVSLTHIINNTFNNEFVIVLINCHE